MAMDFERLTTAAIQGMVQDPDGEYVGIVKPLDGPELRAFIHYIAKAIVQEITDHAEVDDEGHIT